MNFWNQSSTLTKVIIGVILLILIGLIILILIRTEVISISGNNNPASEPTPLEEDTNSQVEDDQNTTITPSAMSTEVVVATPTVTATVDTPVLNGPGIDYEIIARLTAGVTVEVSGISKDGQWWQIIIPNEENLKGWVSNQDVIAENIDNVTVVDPVVEPTQSSTAPPSTGGTVTANTNVNVRGGPGLQYDIIGLLGLGETAEIIGLSINQNWWYVSSPQLENGTGWVFDELVTAENVANVPTLDENGNPIAGEVKIPTPAPGSPSVTAQVNLNIRSGPGTDYELIGLLAEGQKAQVIGKNTEGTWWAINIPSAENGRGWVTELFVQTENVENTPIIDGP